MTYKEDPEKRAICICCSHDNDEPLCVHHDCPHFAGGQNWKYHTGISNETKQNLEKMAAATLQTKEKCASILAAALKGTTQHED